MKTVRGAASARETKLLLLFYPFSPINNRGRGEVLRGFFWIFTKNLTQRADRKVFAA